VLWPVHCVQGTKGAEFAHGLNTDGIHKVFQKGLDREIDSYSGFYDNGHLKDTGLGGYLTSEIVGEVYIMGLATDYCVKYTALDAIKLGFKTWVIEDGVRGVEINQGDIKKAIKEMESAGINMISSRSLMVQGD
jgi:nicotinamidase/pyrazinamidase